MVEKKSTFFSARVHYSTEYTVIAMSRIFTPRHYVNQYNCRLHSVIEESLVAIYSSNNNEEKNVSNFKFIDRAMNARTGHSK
jgi:hypothetical protein